MGNKYPNLFVKFVINSVQATLASIDPNAPFLDAELCARIKHILNYALKVEESWPTTKSLMLCIASKMEQAGHRDDWIDLLERGLSISQRQKDRHGQAEFWLLIGEMLRLRSNFALAKERIQASIDIFEDLGEDQGRARAMNQMAFVTWQQHDLDESKRLAQQALTLLDERDPEQATCFSRLGLVAIDRQQWKEAEQYHRDALRIRQMQGDQRQMAWSLQNLGYALRGQGKYQHAIEHYEQAIDVLERMRDVANCAHVRVNLGIAHSLDGRPTQALAMYAMAEPIYRKLVDKFMLARIQTNYGIEFSTLQRWAEAERAFSTSINLFHELDDVGWRLNSLDGLGSVYLGQGKIDQAIATYEKILDEISIIKGTPMHTYLSRVVPDHLKQARAINENP